MGIDNLNNNFQESNRAYSNQINGPHKKFIIIFSVIFLIVIIGLIIIFYPSSEDIVDEKKMVDDVRIFDNITEKISYDFTKEISSEDGFDFELETCLNKYLDRDYLALIEDNVAICDDTDDPIDCYDFYYQMKAVSSNDLNLCDKSSTLDIASACKGIIIKDSSVCSKFEPGEEQYFCNAYFKGDPLVCKGLSDKFEVLGCEEDYYLVNALISNNKDDCLKLDDEQFQAFCISYFDGDKHAYLDWWTNICNNYDHPFNDLEIV